MQSVSDQQAFWQNMRKISKNKYQPHNSISEKEWFNHFQKVLEQDNYDEDSDDDFENCESDVYYDRPIIREEVLLAIQRLRNGKAAGPDGIIGEFFKHAGHLQWTFWLSFSMFCLTVFINELALDIIYNGRHGVSRTKRALLCIMSKLYRIDCNSINVFLKIFDAQVQPIVLYGAEI